MTMSNARATIIAITHQAQAHPIVGHHGHQTAGQAVLTAEASAVVGLPVIGNVDVTLRSGIIHI